ncbi:hypothetical protein SUDANB171_02635 [Streptomyces sp. enrichment culture]
MGTSVTEILRGLLGGPAALVRRAGERYRCARSRPGTPSGRRRPAPRGRGLRHAAAQRPASSLTRFQRLARRSRRYEVAAAVAAVTVGLTAGIWPPEPVIEFGKQQTAAAEAEAGPTIGPSYTGAEGYGAPLPRSRPTRVRVPSLGTDVEVFGAQLDPDGGPPTPAEEDAMRAAWYSGGVSPGERGAALLVGHLDTYVGPAAFAGLANLQPGETVEVDREDGTMATFIVDAVEMYAKNNFPSDLVYGSDDTPQLRLITCGGAWSAETGYDSNIVAYTHLA